MFELDDDFDIDEEFLDGVFAVEKVASQCTLQASKHSVGTGCVEVAPKKRKNGEFDPAIDVGPEECIRKVGKSNLPFGTAEEKMLPSNKPSNKASCSASASSCSSIWNGDQNHEVNNSPVQVAAERNVENAGSEKCSFVSAPPWVKKAQNPLSSSLSSVNSSDQNKPFFNTSSSKVRQRKFPGPAGLLPERTQRTPLSLVAESALMEEDCEPEESVCSQSTVSVLEDGPWLTLKGDFARERQGLLNHYTVAWVKRKSAGRLLVGQKVPFLAAVLQSVDCSSPDPCIVLRDPTGEIPGTLHRSVWEKFAGQLMVGSAVVLRLVGVLSTGIGARRHYLNITDNNIITIYSLSGSSVDAVSPTTSQMSSGAVRTTKVHRLTIDDLWQTVHDWEKQSRNRRNDSFLPSITWRTNESLNNNNSPPLFNTVSSNLHACVPPKNYSKNHSSPGNHHQLSPQCSFPSATARTNTVSKETNAASLVGPLVSGGTMSQTNRHPSITLCKKFVPKISSFSQSQQIPCERKANAAVPSTPSKHRGDGARMTQSISYLSTTGFDDTDDLEISSVLDGIDSDSLFGEF